jgi:hypothetical protein
MAILGPWNASHFSGGDLDSLNRSRQLAKSVLQVAEIFQELRTADSPSASNLLGMYLGGRHSKCKERC